MAHVFTLEKEYILPLDSIDLSLWGQFIKKPYGDKMLLWSPSNLDGESTYCKVRIEPEEVGEENFLDTSETYMCHICNIEVPQIYYKQHIDSRLHCTHKKLTEKVLENVAKQINVTIDSTAINRKSEFYCDICSKVLLQKHKRKHFKSIYHLESLKRQEICDNFLEIYIKDKDEVSDNNSLKEKDNSDTLLKKDCSADAGSANNNEDEHIDNNDQALVNRVSNNSTPDLPNMVDTDIKDINEKLLDYYINSDTDSELLRGSDGEPKQTKSHNSHSSISSESSSSDNTIDESMKTDSFQQYLKEMIIKYELPCKVPMMEDNLIVIISPKGLKEKVTISTFHGYNHINSFTYCQLCKTWVDDQSLHNRTELHVRNILKPANDVFIREVILNETMSHCLLCNTMVSKESNHAALKHNRYISEPQPQHHISAARNDFPNMFRPQTMPSLIPTIGQQPYNIFQSMEIAQISALFPTAINPALLPFMAIPRYPIFPPSMAVTSNPSIFPRPNVPNSPNLFRNLELPKYPGIHPIIDVRNNPNIFPNKETPKTIDNIPTTEVAINPSLTINKDMPKNLVGEVPNKSVEDVSKVAEPKTTYSDICKISLNPEEDQSKSVETICKDESVKTGNYGYFCDICKVIVPNLNNMDQHTKGRKHKHKVKKKNNAKKVDTSPSTSGDETNIPSTSRLTDVLQESDDKFTTEEKIFEYNKQVALFGTDELMCLVCNITVPKIYEDIIRHMEGPDHRKFLTTILLITKMVQKSIKCFYCELCKYDVDNFIYHVIQDLQHKKNFQAVFKTKSKDPVDFCLPSEYRKVYEEMLERNQIIRLQDISSSFCNSCRITFLRINEIDHMLTGWHKSSLKSTTSN